MLLVLSGLPDCARFAARVLDDGLVDGRHLLLWRQTSTGGAISSDIIMIESSIRLRLVLKCMSVCIYIFSLILIEKAGISNVLNRDVWLLKDLVI